jgi:hypothetical protein
MNKPPVLQRALARLEQANETYTRSKIAEVIAIKMMENAVVIDWNDDDKIVIIIRPLDKNIH